MCARESNPKPNALEAAASEVPAIHTHMHASTLSLSLSLSPYARQPLARCQLSAESGLRCSSITCMHEPPASSQTRIVQSLHI